MLKSLLRLSLAFSVAAPALAAQQAMSHDQHAKPALDAELTEHFKGITLTEAQVRQVSEIKAKHHKAIDALKANPAGRDAAALDADVQKHMAAEHAEFMALLTPEQKKVFEENMKGHHAPAAAKPAMDHGAHGAHDMKKGESKAPTKAPEARRP
jgi:Spy/CpxP family protein refolding chaperone